MRLSRTTQIAVYGGAMAVVLVAGIAALFLLDTAEAPATGMLRPDDPSIVEAGRVVYAESCAGCHGANLEGRMVPSTAGSDELVLAPPHDGSGHTWQHPDQVLFDLTKFGASGVICLEPADKEMPVFEDVLIDRQIVAVLSFIKSTWPEEIQREHDLVNELYLSAQ